MTILDQILADTRALVLRRKTEVPLAALEARAAFRAPTLSLADALRRGGPEKPPAVIAEIKKASPSKGLIAPDFHPVDTARAYKRAGAAAISVLTEPTHFQGSLDILATVRHAADLPLLRKDFIVDAYQLTEARAYGADAVLLIAAALRRDDSSQPPAVIAEIKKASPSKGVIAPDFHPIDTARAYKRAGAAAVSVLTEPTHFQGSLDILSKVRHAADLPLLRKDFIVDGYQLVEARAYGADAVLLIAAALDAEELHDLHDTAADLGLECLVEVHSREELDALDLDRVRVLGVNNRDLRTFDVDVERAPRVLEDVPDRIMRVAESGLKSADDLAMLRRRGIDGVLIGEAFMRSRDPGDALRTLRRDTADLLLSSLRLVS